LKLIGYWFRSLKDEEFVPPQELVAAYDEATRQWLADYLEAGHEFAVYRGISWCRFYNCDEAAMGCRELTDGEWVWPEGLSHYVRQHSVRLPDEFIASARSEERRTIPPEDELARIEPDTSFWIKWCAEHRDHSLASRIQSARQRADAEAVKIKASAIAEREKSEGLSDATCQSKDCTNRALAGRVLCAACVLAPRWSSYDAPYMDLQSVLGG
jgi:hypothetical protein